MEAINEAFIEATCAGFQIKGAMSHRTDLNLDPSRRRASIDSPITPGPTLSYIYAIR